MRLGESEVLWQPVGERDGSGAEGIRIQRQHGDIGSAIDDL
jgi:hypothetical protein